MINYRGLFTIFYICFGCASCFARKIFIHCWCIKLDHIDPSGYQHIMKEAFFTCANSIIIHNDMNQSISVSALPYLSLLRNTFFFLYEQWIEWMNEWMQSIELISIFPQINGNLNKYDVYWFSWFLIAFQFRKLKIIYIGKGNRWYCELFENSIYMTSFPYTLHSSKTALFERFNSIDFIYIPRKIFDWKTILDGRVAMVKYSIDYILF